METTVIVTTRVPALHCWPDAPEPVAHLRHLHRHVFLFRVEWRVSHDDRAIEFLTALEWLQHCLKLYGLYAVNCEGGTLSFGTLSCEQIATKLFPMFDSQDHPVPSAIEVWEDGENGARVDGNN
jgi:hypothetical protein